MIRHIKPVPSKVFHGMLVDVVKDNFVRFLVTGQQDWSTLFLGSPQIQCAELLQDYIQWLVRGGGARFFNSWRKPAEASRNDRLWPAVNQTRKSAQPTLNSS